MKLFFENITENNRVPVESPLEATLSQALEVFEFLPENDGSSMGIVNDEQVIFQISKFNRFLWLVEIPEESKEGSWQKICSQSRCRKIIEEIFQGVDLLQVYDFKFEKY
ncbi:MAG: hypothetical protein WDA08_06565 [Weeksellaceae bacterium]